MDTIDKIPMTICLDFVTLNVDAMFCEFINLSPSISSKSLIISLAKVKKNENIENINIKIKDLFESLLLTKNTLKMHNEVKSETMKLPIIKLCLYLLEYHHNR